MGERGSLLTTAPPLAAGTTGMTGVVVGFGYCVPDRVVTNGMLCEHLGTSDEWIVARTGIRERRMVTPGCATSDLAVAAGRAALESTGSVRADALVLATTTPDHPCPATAPTVAARLGLGTIPAFDVGAVCSGFLYALASAAGLIALGVAGRVLVIGAEAFTTIIDPDDRDTAPIFGDGAGALVLDAGARSERGALLEFELGSDGELADLIMIRGGGSRARTDATHDVAGADPDQFMRMKGRLVFVNAIERMTAAAQAALDRTGWDSGSVDLFVGHQANVRILRAVAERLGVPPQAAFVNLNRYGNTAGASIPIALAEAAANGRLTAGDRVLIAAFGGGVSWGAATLEWPLLDGSQIDRRRE